MRNIYEFITEDACLMVIPPLFNDTAISMFPKFRKYIGFENIQYMI
jgi:hypothetical protein